MIIVLFGLWLRHSGRFGLCWNEYLYSDKPRQELSQFAIVTDPHLLYLLTATRDLSNGSRQESCEERGALPLEVADVS